MKNLNLPFPGHLTRLIFIVLILACILMPVLHAGTLVAGGGQWKVRQVNLSIVPDSLLQAELGLAGSNQTDVTLGVSDLVDFGEGGHAKSPGQAIQGVMNRRILRRLIAFWQGPICGRFFRLQVR